MADKSESTPNTEIETLRKEVRNLTDSVSNIVRREAENARAGVKSAAGSIASTLSSTTDAVSQMGHRLASDAQEGVRYATSKVESCIEHNPLQSVLVATGVGFILGLLSRRL